MRAFVRFFVRDLVIVALTVAVAMWDRASASVLLGLASGALWALTGFLLHEWGHLIGTWMSGGVAHAPLSLSSAFLFNFDVERSDRRQFLAMSYGGYLGTAIAMLLLAMVLDWNRTSGYTAAALTVIGVGVTLALEVPTTLAILRGGPMPTGGVYVGDPKSSETQRQATHAERS